MRAEPLVCSCTAIHACFASEYNPKVANYYLQEYDSGCKDEVADSNYFKREGALELKLQRRIGGEGRKTDLVECTK